MQRAAEDLVSVRRRVLAIAGFVVVLWLLEALDAVAPRNFDLLGIRPRSLAGLFGIPLTPLLHGGFSHLTTNTTALVPLAFFVAARRERDLYLVPLVVTGLGGLCVWLFGAPGSVHIGASLLVFGFLGYLLLVGALERSLGSVALAVLVAFVYGGLFVGLRPGQPGVSWESHFFGFLAGGVCALLFYEKRARAPRLVSA
jgi:membrane associated rhomboid family serine protease